jgi:hypothetical protein
MKYTIAFGVCFVAWMAAVVALIEALEAELFRQRGD